MNSPSQIIFPAVIALAISLSIACSHFSDDSGPSAETEDRTYAINQAQASTTQQNTVVPLTNEDSARDGTRDEMPAGYLPDWIQTSSSKNDRGAAEVIGPDEFREIAKLYKENTLRRQTRFGDNRLIVSNWVDGIIGVNHPQVIWDDQARCEMETTAANNAAIVATDVRREIVVSGIINYESDAFLMTDCRIHGIHCGSSDCQLGFQHALAPKSTLSNPTP